MPGLPTFAFPILRLLCLILPGWMLCGCEIATMPHHLSPALSTPPTHLSLRANYMDKCLQRAIRRFVHHFFKGPMHSLHIHVYGQNALVLGELEETHENRHFLTALRAHLQKNWPKVLVHSRIFFYGTHTERSTPASRRLSHKAHQMLRLRILGDYRLNIRNMTTQVCRNTAYIMAEHTPDLNLTALKEHCRTIGGISTVQVVAVTVRPICFRALAPPHRNKR